MAKLLRKPKIMTDENGRQILESVYKQRTWNREVTCGKVSGVGCGSKMQISMDDVFKEVRPTQMGIQIGYRCKCLYCHEDVIVKHQDTPWDTEQIPDKTDWLKKALHDIVETLHAECDKKDRTRLLKDLHEDGLKLHVLNKFDWS